MSPLRCSPTDPALLIRWRRGGGGSQSTLRCTARARWNARPGHVDAFTLTAQYPALARAHEARGPDAYVGLVGSSRLPPHCRLACSQAHRPCAAGRYRCGSAVPLQCAPRPAAHSAAIRFEKVHRAAQRSHLGALSSRCAQAQLKASAVQAAVVVPAVAQSRWRRPNQWGRSPCWQHAGGDTASHPQEARQPRGWRSAYDRWKQEALARSWRTACCHHTTRAATCECVPETAAARRPAPP